MPPYSGVYAQRTHLAVWIGAPYAAGIGAPVVRRIGAAGSRTQNRKHSPFGNERVMVRCLIGCGGMSRWQSGDHRDRITIIGRRYEGTEHSGYDIGFW